MTNFSFSGSTTSFDVDFGESINFGLTDCEKDEVVNDIMDNVNAELDEIREEEDSRKSNHIVDEDGGPTIVVKASEEISLVDKLKTVTERGLYTVFVQAGCPDNPPGAEGSLSGLTHIRLTEDDAECLHAWIQLFDQNGVMFTRNVADDGDGEWSKAGAADPEGTYTGDYEVTASTEEDIILDTDGKTLTEDIVINKVPYEEVPNESGGTTVVIG